MPPSPPPLSFSDPLTHLTSPPLPKKTNKNTQSDFWINRGLVFEALAEGVLEEDERSARQFYEAAAEDVDHSIILDPENYRRVALGWWVARLVGAGLVGVSSLTLFHISPPPPPSTSHTHMTTTQAVRHCRRPADALGADGQRARVLSPRSVRPAVVCRL
jgi:hypothetical protein